MNEFRVIVLDRPLTVFRGSFGRDAAAIRDALRSNYENGRSAHPADLRATVLHMAISGFTQSDTIERLARRRPDRIGTHVMRLDLEAGHGVCVADTGGPGHWSIWGVPDQLQQFVAEVRNA